MNLSCRRILHRIFINVIRNVFLGEYAAMIMMSGMTTILFLGGVLAPFDIPLLNKVPE